MTDFGDNISWYIIGVTDSGQQTCKKYFDFYQVITAYQI